MQGTVVSNRSPRLSFVYRCIGMIHSTNLEMTGMQLLKFILTCLFLFSGAITTADELADMKIQAEAGDSEAQYLLGLQYEMGDPKVRDDKQAYSWYTKAAEQGHAAAQHR